MQIIPTSSSASAFFSNMDGSGKNDAGFLDAMQNALTAVQDQDSFSATAATPKVESPYVRHTSNGVTYTLSEVCFTKQELNELREQLLKEGAPAETLGKLDVLAGQPDGATLAQVMASLINQGGNIEISEDDAHAITALLGQIDPSGQLASDALELMNAGRPGAAMDLISASLAELGADETITLDAQGMLALGRSLGLNNDNLRNLLAPFKYSESLSVNAGQFDALMAPAKNQLAANELNMQKLDAALDKTLKPLISKARNRMEKEEAASALKNRRADQSRILIDQTVQERSREILDETLTGKPDENIAAQSDIIGKAGGKESNSRLNSASAKAENAADAKSAASALKETADPAKANPRSFIPEARPDEDGGQTASDLFARDDRKQDPRQNLLSKLDIAPAPKSAYATPAAVYASVQGDAFGNLTQTGNFLPNEQELMPMLSQQVEQGVLTAMRDGATRLDLQLHPQELGSLTITLIARNGEVTAQIRSEKSETAEMMSRQLDVIRVNLEQQGVKVDKIEVQLENREDRADNSFQNLDQHNARQEEEARRQEMARMRNLASFRNDNLNTEISGLAQSMHISGQQAINAGRALNIIA